MIIEGGDFFDGDSDRTLVFFRADGHECHCHGCHKDLEPGTVVLAPGDGGPFFHDTACHRRYQENYVRNYRFDPYMSRSLGWGWIVPRSLLLILAGHQRADGNTRIAYRRWLP